MCSSKTKVGGSSSVDITPTTISHIDGRRVLQPNCNTTLTRSSLKKTASKKPSTPLVQPLSSSPATTTSTTTTTPPVSPKPVKSPRPPAIKRSSANNNDSPSNEKISASATKACGTTNKLLKKSKSLRENNSSSMKLYSSSTSLIVEAAGSIAAARREEVANMQVQRKMLIAHYGRTKSAKFEGKVVPVHTSTTSTSAREEKRCNFITPNSDPIYVAYHDEEWGVPAHDDKLLFELLVLTGAQVGSDWTSVLKKRQDFRNAFSGFDAEIVSKYNEKKITSISADYGIEISLVRGVVDNSKRILEVKRELGSLNEYLWGFVNHKPIATQYKSCFKIPVKTSKSESISKDMVRRGFRLVGPTVMHSFMQAAGLTNDHLITCPRHTQCQPSTTFTHNN